MAPKEKKMMSIVEIKNNIRSIELSLEAHLNIINKLSELIDEVKVSPDLKNAIDAEIEQHYEDMISMNIDMQELKFAYDYDYEM
jgi:hypothetical protein